MAPPLGPPLVLSVFTPRGTGAVGVLMEVVAAVPVGGGVPGDGGRSRARSCDRGWRAGGLFVAFEAWSLNLSRKTESQ